MTQETICRSNRKQFFRFLKEHGIYAAYKRNFGLKYIKTWHKTLYDKIGVNGMTFFDVVDWELYINHAFHWASTKEGHEFWLKISKEWSKHKCFDTPTVNT